MAVVPTCLMTSSVLLRNDTASAAIQGLMILLRLPSYLVGFLPPAGSQVRSLLHWMLYTCEAVPVPPGVPPTLRIFLTVRYSAGRAWYS